MRDKILACAQRLVQQRGFNGFSYADIANEVGIRKASLHHHFATKAELGATLISDYSEQLALALTNIGSSSLPANEKLSAYFAIYRDAMQAERMCLGGMLASEALTLDPAMLPTLQRFFADNTKWLTDILKEGQSEHVFHLNSSAGDTASMILSMLQGALLIARVTETTESFEQTVSSVLSNLMREG